MSNKGGDYDTSLLLIKEDGPQVTKQSVTQTIKSTRGMPFSC